MEEENKPNIRRTIPWKELSPEAKNVLERAMKFPADARRELAQKLIDSLENKQPKK